MASEHLVAAIRVGIEWAALGIAIPGGLIIIARVLRVAITRGRVRVLVELDNPVANEGYKHQFGRSLLLGLGFLVAGDVVRTIALEPSLASVAVLGLLVLVPTVLSGTPTVGIEGRWPWQAQPEAPVRTRVRPAGGFAVGP